MKVALFNAFYSTSVGHNFWIFTSTVILPLMLRIITLSALGMLWKMDQFQPFQVKLKKKQEKNIIDFEPV